MQQTQNGSKIPVRQECNYTWLENLSFQVERRLALNTGPKQDNREEISVRRSQKKNRREEILSFLGEQRKLQSRGAGKVPRFSIRTRIAGELENLWPERRLPRVLLPFPQEAPPQEHPSSCSLAAKVRSRRRRRELREWEAGQVGRPRPYVAASFEGGENSPSAHGISSHPAQRSHSLLPATAS